ncbi:MAG: hypothetical protein KAZ30_00395 [Candidatus Magasanikbacteria bacterium]|nr:hypothetical protein [Candidatus Magasanikbacteria bacterium]
MTVLPPEQPLEAPKKLGQNTGKKVEDRLDELEILIRQNMQWSEIIYKDVKKIRRRLFVGQIWGLIKIMLLLAPFVAAAFFLPPYYRQAKQWYVDNIETPRIQLENNLNKVNRYLP